MIRLSLFLLLLVACEGKPSEEQLVRECQNRYGVPDVRGPFKCEMPSGQKRQQTSVPARAD